MTDKSKPSSDNDSKQFLEELNISELSTLTNAEKALFEAVENDDLQSAKKLLKEGARTNIIKEGGPLIFAAVSNDNIEMLALLEAHGAKLTLKHENGNSILHDAVNLELNASFDRLIKRQDLLDLKDWDGNTALNSAGIHNPAVGIKLLEEGADPTIPNNNKDTPLHRLTKNIDNFAPSPARRLHSLAEMKLMIEKGGDANAQDGNGNTPLHYAQSEEVIQLLALGGADPNAPNTWGYTPIFSENPELVTAFHKNGSDPNVTDNQGMTPFYHAAMGTESVTFVRTADIDLLRALKATGANPELTKGYNFPLSAATSNRDIKAIDYLIDNLKVDVNQATPNGYTALHSAANDDFDNPIVMMESRNRSAKEQGRPEEYPQEGINNVKAQRDKNTEYAINKLLAKGANVNAVGKRQKDFLDPESGEVKETPLDHALDSNNRKAAMLLMKAGGKTAEMIESGRELPADDKMREALIDFELEKRKPKDDAQPKENEQGFIVPSVPFAKGTGNSLV